MYIKYSSLKSINILIRKGDKIKGDESRRIEEGNRAFYRSTREKTEYTTRIPKLDNQGREATGYAGPFYPGSFQFLHESLIGGKRFEFWKAHEYVTRNGLIQSLRFPAFLRKDLSLDGGFTAWERVRRSSVPRIR